MELLLIRHAQTPSNEIGALDTLAPGPGLTDVGQQQARALPDRLADSLPHAVIASGYRRAQETAMPLTQAAGLELSVHEGLGEVSAGALEMRTDEPARAHYLEAAFSWARGTEAEPIPRGETAEEFFARYDAAISQAAALGHTRVALVSHGCAIRVWVAARVPTMSVAQVEATALANTGVLRLVGTPAQGWELTDWTHP